MSTKKTVEKSENRAEPAEIDAELDRDAIEAEEIISDEIPEEFFSFVVRHLEHSSQWCIQVDQFGRGLWSTLKQRVRPGRDKSGALTSTADEVATKIIEYVRKHSESDRPAKSYRVRASVIDPRSSQPGSRFCPISVSPDVDGTLSIHDNVDPQGPGQDYWRVLSDTFDAFGRQAIKAHQAVADQAENFAKYSQQMVKMSEANIAMAEKVVMHSVEVERVKMEDRDAQREHEADVHRSEKLYDLARELGPVVVANMHKNRQQKSESKQKEESPKMENKLKISPLAQELTGFLNGLTSEEKSKFWLCFELEERAIIEQAATTTTDQGFQDCVRALQAALDKRAALTELQAAMMQACGVKCLELQTLLEKAMRN